MAGRCVILLVAVFLAWLPPGSSVRAAQEAPSVAGIIVDTGEGERILVTVAFEEDAIAAVDLLERSGLATLTVPFGGLGEGVCMIESTGCDVAACRRSLCQTGTDAPFWQFLAREHDSEWKPSPLGASSVRLSDGDLTAWLWTADAPSGLPESFDDILASTGYPRLDVPARFPEASGTIANSDRRTWITGISMLAVTCVIGGGLALRSRYVAR